MPDPNGQVVKRSTWIPDLLAPLQRANDGTRHELIAGVPHTRPLPSGEQRVIAARLRESLHAYVATHRLGRVYLAPWCILRRFPPTVLACELAYVRAMRAGAWDGVVPLVPDLVVEVLARSQRYLDVVDRVERWLAAGTGLVLLVNLRTRSITMHAPQRPSLVKGRQQLHGADVVPGWRMSLTNVFAAAASPGQRRRQPGDDRSTHSPTDTDAGEP